MSKQVKVGDVTSIVDELFKKAGEAVEKLDKSMMNEETYASLVSQYVAVGSSVIHYTLYPPEPFVAVK